MTFHGKYVTTSYSNEPFGMLFLKKKMAGLWFYMETINEGDGTFYIWTETKVASKQIPAYYNTVREEVSGP